VNVNEAQASVEADFVRIRAQIDESIGTDEFHAAVKQKLMAVLSLSALNAPSKSKRGGRRNRTTQVSTKGRSKRERVQPHPLIVWSAREEEDQTEQHKQHQKESAVKLHLTCSGVGIGGTGEGEGEGEGGGGGGGADRTPHTTQAPFNGN
jgi:hypothetical protein